MDREEDVASWQVDPKPVNWRFGFRTYAIASAQPNEEEEIGLLRSMGYTDAQIAKLEATAVTIATAIRETQEMLPADTSNSLREHCFLMTLGMPMAMAGHFLAAVHPPGYACPTCIARWMQCFADAMSEGIARGNVYRDQAAQAVN